MVKSPKIRHSKPRAEPVTIDLSADDVSTAPKSGAPENDTKSTGAKPEAAASTVKADEAKPAASTPSSPNARPSGAAPSGFGRDPSGPAMAKPDAAPKDSAGPKPAAAAARQRSGFGGVVAGLVGGIIALAAAIALYTGGYLPPPSQPPAAAPDNSAVEQLQSEIAGMRAEIAALKSAPPVSNGDGGAALDQTNTRVESMAVMVEDLRGQISRLSESVAAGAGGDNAGLAALQARLTTIEGQVAALPEAGAGSDALAAEIAQMDQAISQMRDAASTASAEMGARVGSLEESLAALSTRVDEQAQKPGAAVAIAASALKAAIDRGQPFATELETYAMLAPDAPEIAALRDMAASGVPTLAEITSETDATAVAMIAAAQPESSDASLLDRLWASAGSLVTVRPIGAVEGDGVPAIVARMEAALKNGNYAAALSEYDMLPDTAKAAGSKFAAKVKARQAADELIGKALANALRA